MPKDEELEETEEPEEQEKVSKEQESDLEKAVEDLEEVVDTGQFQEFMASESSAPILNQVEEAQQIIGLEQGIASEQVHTSLKENESSKYNIPQEQEDEKKYNSDYSGGMVAQQIDISQVGREKDPIVEQRNFFTQSSELRGIESQTQEKYQAPERIDLDKAGTKDILKREDKKYDPRLNLPKP